MNTAQGFKIKHMEPQMGSETKKLTRFCSRCNSVVGLFEEECHNCGCELIDVPSSKDKVYGEYMIGEKPSLIGNLNTFLVELCYIGYGVVPVFKNGIRKNEDGTDQKINIIAQVRDIDGSFISFIGWE